MITAAATRTMRLIAMRTCRQPSSPRRSLAALQSESTRPMTRELPCDAAAARSALQRELQRLARALVDVAMRRVRRDAEMREPPVDGREIIVLRERVERDPQPEPFRQRDLFLDGFARMNLLADVLRLEVLSEIFRQQVTAVRRRIDDDVRRGACDRAVQHHLQRLVTRLARVERQVVAEHNEAE